MYAMSIIDYARASRIGHIAIAGGRWLDVGEGTKFILLIIPIMVS